MGHQLTDFEPSSIGIALGQLVYISGASSSSLALTQSALSAKLATEAWIEYEPPS